jgi:hypothetical protein
VINEILTQLKSHSMIEVSNERWQFSLPLQNYVLSLQNATEKNQH